MGFVRADAIFEKSGYSWQSIKFFQWPFQLSKLDFGKNRNLFKNQLFQRGSN